MNCIILVLFFAIFTVQGWFEFTNTLNEPVNVKVFFDNQQYKEFIVLPNANSGRLYASAANEAIDRFRITKIVFAGTNDVIVGWDYVATQPGNNWGNPIFEKLIGDFVIDNPLGIPTKTFPLKLKIIEQPNTTQTNLIKSQLPAVYSQWYPNVSIGGSRIIAERY